MPVQALAPAPVALQPRPQIPARRAHVDIEPPVKSDRTQSTHGDGLIAPVLQHDQVAAAIALIAHTSTLVLPSTLITGSTNLILDAGGSTMMRPP